MLSHLKLILLVLCAGGIALAAALGRMAARGVLSPLAEVAQTAKYIGETDDLSHRIAIHAEDEVGQLARRFNAMLERLQGSRTALDESVRAQRQLVADASHELRTPVTSLRTSRRSSIERPAKGSSSNRIRGFWASAMAISTRRRSPYEVWASGRSARWSRATRASVSCARARSPSCRPSLTNGSQRSLDRPSNDSVTLRNSVSPWKSVMIW